MSIGTDAPGTEAKNILALNKQAFLLKFDLEGTDYEPIENIGSGAYGIVCSAICKKTKERVAIKKIASVFDHPDIGKKTYREIKILRHFKHDNIISIRDILKPKTDDFKEIQIVLDFMESDLHKIIHTQKLSDEHIRYFLYQILRGLKYIHSANVIHRDLKPSNLLVNGNCELKIGDFGMARGVSVNPRLHNPVMTQYVATRWYRAPELIISDEEYSFAVDLWSVGCILAEMLGQMVLFRGRNHVEQFSMIIQKCGTPSKSFIDTYAMAFIQAFSKTQYKPADWAKEFPKAHKKAIDILGKLILIDPRERLTAENALRHPYLSKYHEPQDEPVCIPAFNFDFEERTTTREQLRKVITEEIMSYHQPPKVSFFNLKPMPKEELEQLMIKKQHQQQELPQLSPRTTGLESFLHLQQSLQNKKDETFKKPLPATHALAPNSSSDTEMLSARSVKCEDARLSVQPNLSTSDVEMISAKKSPNINAKTEQRNMNDNSQKLNEHQTQTEQNTQQPSQPPMSSLDAKQKLKEAILKGQKKQPQVMTENRAKPITAYQKQKEKERRKKEKMDKAKRKKSKLKGQEHKNEPEMSELDKNILARWESMQQSKQDSHGDAKPGTETAEKENVLHTTTETQVAATVTNQKQDFNSFQMSEGNSNVVQANSLLGSSEQRPAYVMNLASQIFPQGLNISQNIYIPLASNLSVTSTMANDSNNVIYTLPQAQGYTITAKTSLTQNTGEVSYGLPQPPQTLVLVEDVPSHSTQNSNNSLIASQPLQQLYQAPAQGMMPFTSYYQPSEQAPSTQLPTYTEAMQAKDPTNVVEKPSLEAYQRRSYCDLEDTQTPWNTPSNTPEHITDYKDIGEEASPAAPAAADMEQEMKKMKINSHLQPALPIQVHTPKATGSGYGVGFEHEQNYDSKTNEIDSGMMESAPASGLKRDWQQAINMDPKELEEALRTVMQSEMLSPRFVSSLMEPKH